MRRLIAAAPGNADYKANAAKIFLSLGQALLQAGRLEEAQETARMTLEMCQLEARRNQDTAWSGPRLGGARVLSLKVAAARARSLAEQAIALQPVAVEARRLAGLGRSHPRNMALALVASEADLLAGDRESLEDHSDNARAQWTAAVQTLENAGVDNLPSTDRGRAILRQLEFRLRSGQASAEPILTRPAATASKRPKGGGLIVYEW
jgi:tetratricopeptide (TPR) repeat protein